MVETSFANTKMLKMIKYTSLPNLVRLAQWEQVSDDDYDYDYDYYYIRLPVKIRARRTSSPTQLFGSIRATRLSSTELTKRSDHVPLISITRYN